MDVTYVRSLSLPLPPSISMPNVVTTERVLSKVCIAAQLLVVSHIFIYARIIIVSIQSAQPVSIQSAQTVTPTHNVLLNSHNLPGLLIRFQRIFHTKNFGMYMFFLLLIDVIFRLHHAASFTVITLSL
jgi:hypothetical protein